MTQYFIGIDVSTTASKALVIDAEGNIIATKSYPHALSTPQPLWSEQDPHEWWDATSHALRDVLEIVPADQIVAIGLTGQMHGLTALDAHGDILRPAILWNDQRSGAQCNAVTEKIGDKRLYQIVGTRMLPGFTGPKMRWVIENEPEVAQKISKVLLPKDYIRYRLSGAHVTDVADGSGYGLMDVGNRTWSQEVLAAFEIPASWMPDLCESSEICAYVNEVSAAATGLKVGTPIVGGAGDQPAGGIGSGIVAPGQVSLTIGTSGVAYALNNHYSPEPEGRLHTFCGPIPGTWFHMGVMLSAAGSFRWFKDEFASGMTYDQINAAVEKIKRGSEGLLFAPYLTGERNPHPDPYARGAFVGLTIRHTLPHLARAVMEGVAYGMRDNLELLRAQGIQPIDAVVSGGAINSSVWRQMITDIMQMPLYTVNTTEGAAFGAAVLSTVGSGVWSDVATACQAMVRKVDETRPNSDSLVDYDRFYKIFGDVYPSLQSISADLSFLE